jgi:hypothetical protein
MTYVIKYNVKLTEAIQTPSAVISECLHEIAKLAKICTSVRTEWVTHAIDKDYLVP